MVGRPPGNGPPVIALGPSRHGAALEGAAGGNWEITRELGELVRFGTKNWQARVGPELKNWTWKTSDPAQEVG